jgi:hypothetical protein
MIGIQTRPLLTRLPFHSASIQDSWYLYDIDDLPDWEMWLYHWFEVRWGSDELQEYDLVSRSRQPHESIRMYRHFSVMTFTLLYATRAPA